MAGDGGAIGLLARLDAELGGAGLLADAHRADDPACGAAAGEDDPVASQASSIAEGGGADVADGGAVALALDGDAARGHLVDLAGTVGVELDDVAVAGAGHGDAAGLGEAGERFELAGALPK